MPRQRPIPPDPEGRNNERAEWAFVALREFIAITGIDREDAVADLLTDLKHWCDRNGMSFHNELRRAEALYRDETRPLPEGEVAPPPPTVAEMQRAIEEHPVQQWAPILPLPPGPDTEPPF